MQKHVLQMQLRHFVPPAFVLFLVIGLLLSPVNLWTQRLWLGGLLTNVTATLIAAFATARRTGWERPWLLPVGFWILHISYGSGFLVGLIRFARRSGQVPAIAGPDARVAP